MAHGPLAQLVAHLHDAQGVRGSSPLRPTDREAARTGSPAKGTRRTGSVAQRREFLGRRARDVSRLHLLVQFFAPDSKNGGAGSEVFHSIAAHCLGHGTRLERSHVAIDTGVELGEFIGYGKEFVVARVTVAGL